MSLLLFAAAQAVTLPPVAPPAAPVPFVPAAPPAISWEVADRFRLFDHADAAARQRIAAAMAVLAANAAPLDDRSNYDLLLTTLSGPDAASLRVSNIVPRGANDKRSNRYAPSYLYPDHYTISVTATGAPADAQCHWSVAGVAVAGTACTAQQIDVPALPGGEGASAEVVLAIGDGPALPAVTIAFKDELIVALGDSYISGEGNPDVPAGFHAAAQGWGKAYRGTGWASDIRSDQGARIRDVTPATWWDPQCHRSLLSWPVLVGLAHAAHDPHRAVTLVHLGCSGDEVDDGLLIFRKKLPGGGAEHQSQMEMLRDLRDRAGKPRRGVDTLLLSIGGNDIGFGSVVAGLILPADGWRFSWVGTLVAGVGGAACAYRTEVRPLALMCGSPGHIPGHGGADRRSAEERFAELSDQLGRPGRLGRLATAFAAAGIAPATIFQASYPNSLLDDEGQMCRTALPAADIEKLRQREARGEVLPWSAQQEEDYARAHPWRVDAGYEGLIAKIPGFARSASVWRFQLQYFPDRTFGSASLPPDLAAPLEVATAANAQCDWNTDPTDSGLCQGYWTWAMLNRRLAENAVTQGWTLVTDFQDKIRPHGWCNADARAPLALPLADGAGGWRSAGWRAGDFRPYDFDLPRWFRTTNDSIMAEWAGSADYHFGTIHPTYHAHLTIAAAMEARAFGGQ